MPINWLVEAHFCPDVDRQDTAATRARDHWRTWPRRAEASGELWRALARTEERRAREALEARSRARRLEELGAVLRRALLEGACAGRPDGEAPAFVRNTVGIHPVGLVAPAAREGSWSAALPREWAADPAQLVACVGEVRPVRIETCRYNGPAIERYRNEVSIRLVARRTGRTVARTRLRGAPPRRCRRVEPYELTRLEGATVEPDALARWLARHVVTLPPTVRTSTP